MKEGPYFYILHIFQGQKLSYLSLFNFLYKHYFCFISEILGRVNDDVMNEEGKERPQSTFHEQCLQTGKNKTGQL
jgi:hypothetical protein